eukprot:PhF_6_TR25157/c0_g1_i1/m.34671
MENKYSTYIVAVRDAFDPQLQKEKKLARQASRHYQRQQRLQQQQQELASGRHTPRHPESYEGALRAQADEIRRKATEYEVTLDKLQSVETLEKRTGKTRDVFAANSAWEKAGRLDELGTALVKMLLTLVEAISVPVCDIRNIVRSHPAPQIFLHTTTALQAIVSTLDGVLPIVSCQSTNTEPVITLRNIRDRLSNEMTSSSTMTTTTTPRPPSAQTSTTGSGAATPRLTYHCSLWKSAQPQQLISATPSAPQTQNSKSKKQTTTSPTKTTEGEGELNLGIIPHIRYETEQQSKQKFHQISEDTVVHRLKVLQSNSASNLRKRFEEISQHKTVLAKIVPPMFDVKSAVTTPRTPHNKKATPTSPQTKTPRKQPNIPTVFTLFEFITHARRLRRDLGARLPLQIIELYHAFNKVEMQLHLENAVLSLRDVGQYVKQKRAVMILERTPHNAPNYDFVVGICHYVMNETRNRREGIQRRKEEILVERSINVRKIWSILERFVVKHV